MTTDELKRSQPGQLELEKALLFAEAVNHRVFNRENKALQCLGQLLALEPTHIPTLNECGLMDMAKGRLDHAAECFEKVLAIDPRDPYALNYLSMLHRERQELDKASARLQEGLEFNPHNPHLLTQLALVANEMGMPAKAGAYLQKAKRHRNVGNQVSHQAEILAKYMAPGVVIAGLAHEIKNIVESTNLAIDLVRDDLSRLLPQEERREIDDELARIEKNEQRVVHLIKHFREVVKRGKPEPTMAQASELVGYAFDLLGAKLKSMKIRWGVDQKPSADECPIYGNKVELEQVFVNLISNAYDALVDAQSKSPRIQVEISQSSSRPGVLIRIADNGPGIPEDVAARMFELSYTTKSTGTGVGLWLCAFAVERADGQIELENTGPLGTTFKLHFPFQGEIHAKSQGASGRR